ncbi:MAG: integrase [Deltaproteobacteria bacterium]|jgi:hypothetical protein|nr:integrase [Deltaproteobacteria bacterium]
MSNIILFTPQSKGNIESFILKCRNELSVFGKDLNFDSDLWDVTNALNRKAMGNKRERIRFSNLKTAKDKSPESMHPAFKDFAKAYIRYHHALRPSQSIGHRLGALRVIEAALAEHGLPPAPHKLNVDILNRAVQIANSYFKSPALIHRIGGQFQQIVKFMNTNKMVSQNIFWKNPLKRPPDAVRVGKKADEDRLKKMPSEASLDAIPEVYKLATEPNEILISSTAAILFCMPSRIHEVLELPLLCEDETTYGKRKKKVYSLRWWPGKYAKPMLKPVLAAAEGLVREALAKIRSVTEEARTIARWYIQHPDMIYLDENTEPLRQKNFLLLQEVSEVLGLPHLLAVREWCKSQKITLHGPESKVSFDDLEKAVLRQLPANFPILAYKTGLRYDEALFVVLKNQLHSTHHTLKCIIEPVNINTINYGLGARVAHGSPSIFTRLGFTEPDGSPIVINSHQFRHYLNTLAQLGGLSQLDIAKWSGRANVSQNVVYDHVTDDQALALVRSAVGDSSLMFGPMKKVNINMPMTRDKYAALKIQTAHTTDIGFCINDFTMNPCDHYRDCLFCKHLVCLKCDKKKQKNILARLKEANDLMIMAQNAVNEGYYGSDRWLEHHKQTVARLTELHTIMKDPNIHQDAVIQLAQPRQKKQIKNSAKALAMKKTHEKDKRK